MGDTKVLMSDGGGNRRKPSAEFVDVLTRWMAKWADTFPSHVVTKLQIATYAETLGDLSPEQLDATCRLATRNATQFPKPGDIRNAFKQLDNVPRTRPAYLDEPIAHESERWTEEEQRLSNQLRQKLGIRERSSSSAKR